MIWFNSVFVNFLHHKSHFYIFPLSEYSIVHMSEVLTEEQKQPASCVFCFLPCHETKIRQQWQELVPASCWFKPTTAYRSKCCQRQCKFVFQGYTNVCLFFCFTLPFVKVAWTTTKFPFNSRLSLVKVLLLKKLFWWNLTYYTNLFQALIKIKKNGLSGKYKEIEHFDNDSEPESKFLFVYLFIYFPINWSHFYF